MNLKHNGLGRLEKAAPSGIINGSMLDPVAGKATAPRDTLTEVLRSFREIVVESGEDESMRELLSRFRRALLDHETTLDRSKAAREFGQAIDRILVDRQLGRAMKSSMAKGMSPAEFWRR
jgi:hypothetical protein